MNKIITILIGQFLFSCNGTTTQNLETAKFKNNINHSDTITFGNLIGTWILKDSNVNVNFKSFKIDSSGFHNITDSAINHYKLLVEGNKFSIGIYVTENKNLITYYSHDTLKIYWTSGQHETYIRQTKSTKE